MSITVPKCVFCKNLIQDDEEFRCSAFPEGIPEDILWEAKIRECNNGIGYEE